MNVNLTIDDMSGLGGVASFTTMSKWKWLPVSGCRCLSRNFNRDGILTFMSRRDSCTKTFGDYVIYLDYVMGEVYDLVNKANVYCISATG
jgi:hypothetical protein